MIIYWKYTNKHTEHNFVLARDTKNRLERCVCGTSDPDNEWIEWDYDTLRKERVFIEGYDIVRINKEKAFLEMI